MAFEALLPHKSTILEWRDERLTLARIADRLASEHGVRTTPGTLSRFLRETSPKHGLREGNAEERSVIDALTLLTEVLAEIRGRGEEQRKAVEYLAGQVRVLTEVVDGRAAAQGDVAAPVPPRRGRGAVLFVTGAVLGAAGGALAVWWPNLAM
ncbi:MAG: hypothetical protein AAFQ11_01460 [Pseudomonadota bacterium]